MKKLDKKLNYMTVPAAIKRAGKNRNGTSVRQYIPSGSCSNSEPESNIEALDWMRIV